MLLKPILAVAATALLAGCGGPPANEAAPEGNESNTIALPSIPVPAPPMDRAALVMAAIKSASAAATGTDDSEAQRELDGNRFELRIRFGCGGPLPQKEKTAGSAGRKAAASQSVMSWRFDPKERTLRLRADTDVSKDDPLVAAVAGQDVEAVEGFWIPRPWMLDAACPAAMPKPPVTEEPAEADGATTNRTPEKAKTKPEKSAPQEADEQAVPATPAPAKPVHSIAIAQFFSATDSRLGRRDDRPYQATKLLDEGVQPSAEGYNLVLSGRLKRLPNGRTIACPPAAAEQRPKCVISADFDRVWIERPDTRAIVAEWASGG